MAITCEVCGRTEESANLREIDGRLQVCQSCVNDRRPHETMAAGSPENAAD